MKKLFIAAFMFVFSLTSNVSADGHGIKMGIILGFTGPIESLTPAMAASAELAFKEASDSGSLLGGKKIYIPKRPGEPDITFANIRRIKKEIQWKPLISIEEGIADLIRSINDWKSAPVWTPLKIKKQTKKWFQYLK